jgi:predicted aldo/keto reductase-like oxidoreductase
MTKKTTGKYSRRKFMELSSAVAGMAIIPWHAYGCDKTNVIIPDNVDKEGEENVPQALLTRRLGKTNFQASTFGLGGQSSLQWTPKDVDPVKIILKAFELGVNYYDTSNLYGPSQLNYGKAFKTMHLIPGEPNYNEALRKSIFLTSKTAIRWAKGNFPTLPRVNNNSNGNHGEGAVADLKRTLSQIFGDNNGNYPEGAYLDMILAHNVTSKEQVDVLYKGLETPLDVNDNFGALVALRDYRDGTNLTGLNPKYEKLIKHIGFSGHSSASVMMEMIRRDKWDLLDGMLVAINVNDRRYLNMQYNVIEVAKAKDIGIIGMKVFADGAMYTRDAAWGTKAETLVMSVGSEAIPSKSLIEYTLTTPGVDTLIIGIGHIDDNPLACQLTQNIKASQILPDALSAQERRELEKFGLKAKNGNTNYFQVQDTKLIPPSNIKVNKQNNVNKITWDTAIAGDEPISHYEILKDGVKVKEIKHLPQTTSEPFAFEGDLTGSEYVIAVVDKAGRKAMSNALSI